jgi:hypothetical protein
MKFEQGGVEDNNTAAPKRSVEFQGQQFEVLDLNRVNADQVEVGDRAFISTQSGNRYMLRRSKSGGDRLYGYTERDQFSNGGPLSTRTLQSDLAEIGKALHWEIDQLNRVWDSTPVTAIELRKGIDTAVESSKNTPQAKSLGQMLIDRVHGRRKDGE